MAHESGATPADDRLEGSVALAAWSAYLGADVVRVHDVRQTVDALKVLQATLAG